MVMRHAKAEQSGPSDFERQLSDRGTVDATEAGQWLANRGVEPHQALVSAAVRTQQTWEAVNEGGAGTSRAPSTTRSTRPAPRAPST